MSVRRWFSVLWLACAACGLAACGDENGDHGDPCTDVTCSSRGYCVASGDEAQCFCMTGYHDEGLACLPNDPGDPCAGVSCLSHGTCRVAGTEPYCDCETDYTHPDPGDPVCADSDCDLICAPAGAADAQADADVGADTDGDADADGDADTDGDADADGDLDGEADGADAVEDVPCTPLDLSLDETNAAVVVPAGARFLHVKAWGAGGNAESGCTLPEVDGGVGGYTEAVFAVSASSPVVPGESLIVVVGDPAWSADFRRGFGANGGGGLSGVFTGGTLLTESDFARALVIAGGGGGASLPGCHPAGTGNNPDPTIAGGEATMRGGDGADDNVNGGGGGYRGGSGGPHGLGGLGGTGFVVASPAVFSSELLSAAPGTYVPPENDDPECLRGTGQVESAGLVVLHFSCDAPDAD